MRRTAKEANAKYDEAVAMLRSLERSSGKSTRGVVSARGGSAAERKRQVRPCTCATASHVM